MTRSAMARDPLPIDELLPAITAAVREHGQLLLSAEPGSGKTTRAPAALLEAGFDGGVVVLEPRRLAARAAAARVADELGVEVGGLVGYQVRGDRRIGRSTRLSFVTEGVLVRRLVQDPFLDGTAVVVLDEFHERHLEGDLALAMLREVRDTVRPDLRLCVMSATLDLQPLRAFLPGAPEIRGDGRLHPVRVEHEARRDDGPLEHRVRAMVDRALADTPGDVLVFLPGIGEIARCEAALGNLAQRTGALVLPLHGRLAPRDQDLAIRPQPRRKVVLSTNVAESSLTIPGVTAVVDSGLCRELRFDRGRGVDVLALARISQASATQRAGRAGRTGPGVCYRLWTAGEERGMPARTQPDVERVDLCGPALQVRAFAGRDPREFAWFEAPPPAALQAADELLQQLGATDAAGKVTATGRDLLELPLHPRLGAVALAGRARGCAAAAATAAVLLSEVDQLGREGGADLLHAAAVLAAAAARGLPAHLCRDAGVTPDQARAVLRTRDRLLPRDGRRDGGPDARDDDAALAACLLQGFPDRVAARPSREGREAVMVGGRGVTLPPAADGHDLVLALRLHEAGRQQRSQVTVFAALDPLWLERDGLLQPVADAELDEAQGRVVGVRTLCYRDLALRRARGGAVPPARTAALLRPLLLRDPARWLGDQRATDAFVGRVEFLRQRMPELELPALGPEQVASAALQHLGDGTDLRTVRDADLSGLLAGTLGPQQLQALQRHAPERVRLPSGRSIAIDYAAPAGPTVRARMQELFGLPSVAALAGGRVPLVLELLAPNHRPVQVTTDLPSFWANVYPTVRRELQRRYPRHSWPEDPRTAPAEARPRPRRPR
ncbi:MAG: ATP-dependent helicase HrpB [Planctomycetota bacterium]